MPQVTPPQGGAQAQQADPAQEAIQQIQSGFQQLGQMIQKAGQNLDPQDIKLFQNAVQATDDFLQALSGPAEGEQGQGPVTKSPGGPMPMNANAQAKPPSISY